MEAPSSLFKVAESGDKNAGFAYLPFYQVDLEMAFGLDTDSFLRCFVRMISRGGYPFTIVSDRGTNFVGAGRELRELVDGLDQNRIQDQTVDKGVKSAFFS